MACQLVVSSVELLRGQQAASKGLCRDQLCVVRRCVSLMRGERAPQSCWVSGSAWGCRLGRSQASALQL